MIDNVLSKIINDNNLCMLLNGIIGDIYGAPIEMMPYEIIHINYGKIMNEYIMTDKMIDRKYSYTDDTEMTLAVLDFIIDVNNNKILLTKENMLKYFIKHYEPFRGYSSKVSKLFLNYIYTNEIVIQNSKGNGSLMRVSPISLICYYDDDEKIKQYINIIHYPTHLDEESLEVSYLYIKILIKFKEISKKEDKHELIKNLIIELYNISSKNIKTSFKLLIDNFDIHNEYDLLQDLLGLDGILCYEALSTALWCIIKNLNNPRQILAKGIFYGGDCDTIGSLIGQMSGILFGSLSINKDWLKNIENLDNIYNLYKKFSI